MKPQNTAKKLAPLLELSSFTSQDAKIEGVSSASLAYYVKKGLIERIGHGVYRGIYSPKVSDFRWENLVESVQRVRNGIVCLTSALALYDLTEEIPRQHWIAIPNETMHRAPPSTKVIRMRNTSLGKTEINLDGISIPIFDRERVIVDSFRYLSRETAIKALKEALQKKGEERINLEKLRKYAKTLRVKIEPYILAVTT